MPTKTIELSQQDLDSVQRLLTSLTSAEAGRNAPGPGVTSGKLLEVARTLLALRKRRTEYLHRSMLGEPAYDMLLALYVAGGDDQTMTAAHVAKRSGVAQSSALRWIDYLVSKQLVERGPHPSHKRAFMLQLSPKGRAALEGFFREMLEGLEALAV